MLIAPSDGKSLKRRIRFDGTRHAKDARHTGQDLSGDLSTKCRPTESLDFQGPRGGDPAEKQGNCRTVATAPSTKSLARTGLEH